LSQKVYSTLLLLKFKLQVHGGYAVV